MENQTGTPLTERKVVRRGLIGGLAGLGAAALLKLNGAGRAEAGHNTTTAYAATGVLHLGEINDGGNIQNNLSDTSLAARTALVATVDQPAFQAMNPNTGTRATGIFGSSNGGYGVVGIIPTEGLPPTNARAGVFGMMTDTGAPGIYGRAAFSDPGVRGESGGGAGVFGISKSGVSADVPRPSLSAGVVGQGFSRAGVRGLSDTQPGVDGTSTSSLGVRGTSTDFVGIVGISTNSHGLYGSTNSLQGIGIVAENLSGGQGLLVTGSAQIYGSLEVFGAKSAVIKMQDGTNAAVYCQESPEPYFEDFGRAQLTAGTTFVQLEREFTTLVAGGDYMVFLTPEGPSGGLYVSRRTPAGFEVRDPGNGNVSFTYRIVTRRKDIEGRRFARVSDERAKGLAAVRAAAGITGSPQPPAGNPNPGPPAPGGGR